MLGNNNVKMNVPMNNQMQMGMGIEPSISQKSVLILQVPEGFKLVYSYGQNDPGNYNETVKTLQEVFGKVQMFLADTKSLKY